MRLLTLFLASALFLLNSCGPPPLSRLNGTLIEPPIEVPDFQFNTANGPVRLNTFRGKYTLMAFGYTFCPDACPTTMARLKRVIDSLGSDADKVQVMLVSVDPERDTPALLKSYTENFNPDFIGATPASPDSVFNLLGVYVERANSSVTEDYTVDHTTSIILLDKQGNWRLVWNFETTPEEIASDMNTLIALP